MELQTAIELIESCRNEAVEAETDLYMGENLPPKTVVGWVRADCIILPEPTLEWQIDISVGPELCINTPYK